VIEIAGPLDTLALYERGAAARDCRAPASSGAVVAARGEDDRGGRQRVMLLRDGPSETTGLRTQ